MQNTIHVTYYAHTQQDNSNAGKLMPEQNRRDTGKQRRIRLCHWCSETHCQRHVVYSLGKWPQLRTEDFVAIKTRTMCMSRVQNPVVNLVLVAYDARSRHLHSLLVLDMTGTKRTTNTEEKGKHQCFTRCSNCKIGLANMFNLTFKAKGIHQPRVSNQQWKCNMIKNQRQRWRICQLHLRHKENAWD